MKRYLGILFAIAFAITGVSMAFSKYKAKSIDNDRNVNMARIKQEYLERAGWIRSNPDAQGYKSEVQTFFRWYFNEVNEHLNRFQGNTDFDDYLGELASRSASGAGDSQLEQKKAYYEYTRKVFDQFKDGRYAPEWSATDKGMRLDIVSATPAMNGGSPAVRYQLVLWGAQRQLREDGRMKKMVTSASFSVSWRLFDKRGKLLGEMSASGDPSMKVDFPERMIAEFPPQMVLGYFDMDLVPADVKDIEMSILVSSRSPSGGDAQASFVWKRTAPDDWKLRPGEEWKGATESFRSQEEIDGKSAAN